MKNLQWTFNKNFDEDYEQIWKDTEHPFLVWESLITKFNKVSPAFFPVVFSSPM